MIRTILGAAIGMLSGLINGVLGAGGGTIIVPALERFLKVPAHKAHATAISIILPLTIVSAYFYSRQGLINMRATLIISLSGIAGGFAGAKFLRNCRKNNKNSFAVSMIVAGLKCYGNNFVSYNGFCCGYNKRDGNRRRVVLIPVLTLFWGSNKIAGV